jgi:hypothetical protein
MSQKNWAQYFLATGKPENTEIGWSPGEESGRMSPQESWKKFEEMSSPPSSPKSTANIFATSYKASGKSRKRRERRKRKSRKASRRSRRR